MNSFKKALRWLDMNLLLVLSGFLLAFIPLFPKLPLFDAIPGYIVRVRLEDIFILITALIWLVQVVRKKVTWVTPFVWLIGAYSVVGLLSLLSGVFLIKTIPPELLHIGKSALHFVRYLEYFSLFVIVFSAIKSRKHVIILLSIFAVTLTAIAIYGYGQRYYYWPVYSTMNREFSKGLRLYLTEHARVQSTFGGHYDLAAYLVVVLPLILVIAFMVKKWWLKLLLQTAHWLGLWLMIMSASRTSFLAYGVGIGIVLVLWAGQQRTVLAKVWWGISRSLFVGVMITLLMMRYGSDMYERFLQVLEGQPQAHEFYHHWNGERKKFFGEYLPTQLAFLKLPSFSLPEAQKPVDAVPAEDIDVMVASDVRPVTERPSDVYVDVPVTTTVATTSADGTVSTIQVQGPRTYSEAALKHGLSLAIRLDTLWPQALRGFLRNPVVGSGYATLNKDGPYHFTEAESTDNNFLRTLGETGLLGFVTFYGVVVLGLVYAFRQLSHPDRLSRALSIGFIAATVGLLINAVYIDVFAASKVAFTYWSLAGLLIGYIYHLRTLPPPVQVPSKKMPSTYRKPSQHKARKSLTFHE